MEKKEIGAYLRENRKRAGMTLVELSASSNVSQPYLSSLENGKYKPSWAQIVKIANGLTIRPSKMLEDIGYTEHAKIQLLEETGASVEDSLNDIQHMNAMLKMELENRQDIEMFFSGRDEIKTLSTDRDDKITSSFTFSFRPHYKGIELTDKENKFILSTIEALLSMREREE